ncbi:PAS domain S-box protein [Candidatus Synechococcus calcipolaris G9]|uniref:PAS domain S-box protein n=1 Tax=Candidatus Synechococcus calcipolaris G9 TaxID=1497997 RepID=A0ABT6EWV3_9SYNE|nr:EAL domain-containing protein [Candidatus Synechococcus calcipolaris]MDG2990251.1 PAS domain S-box protein [Candidatus Synechococcus calcipolaris G9]
MIPGQFEHYTELLANYTDDLICIHEADGTYLYLTPSSESLLGYRPEELVGKSPYALFHPDDSEKVRTGAHQLSLQGVTDLTITYRIRKKNGSYIWFETLTHPIADERHEVMFLITTSRDITQRKQVEGQLQASQELLEAFFSQSLDGCFFMMLDRPINWDNHIDKDAILNYVFEHQRITRVNQALAKQHRLPREELLGLTPLDCFADDLGKARQFWRALFDLGTLYTELELKRRDGSSFWIEGNYVCLYDDQGCIRGHFAVQRDITDRRRMQGQLEQKNQELELFFNSSLDLFTIADTEGYFHRLNQEWENVLGYGLAELTGVRFLDFVHPEDIDQTEAAIATLKENSPILNFSNRYRCKDGSYRWLEWRSFPFQGLIYASARDITDQRNFALRLETAYRQTSEILESMSDSFFAVDADFHITYANQHFCDTFALEKTDVLDQNLWDIFPGAVGTIFEEQIQRALREQTSVKFEALYSPLERWFSVQIYTTPTGLAIFFQDVSDRINANLALERRNQQAELLLNLTLAIRQSLDLDEVLQTTLDEIRHLLGIDRTIIYKFNPDWSGIIAKESVSQHKFLLLGQVFNDPCFGANYIEPYCQGWVVAIDDIYTAEMTACYREFLESIQVRANLVVPVIQGDRLWGLLLCQHCTGPRPWSQDEIELLRQLGEQLGIAIQRAELVTALNQEKERYRRVLEAQTELLYRCRPDGVLTFANPAFFRYVGCQNDTCEIGHAFEHPFDQVDRDRFAHHLQALTIEHPIRTIECSVTLANGSHQWYEWTNRAIFDPQGNCVEYQCLGRDITKQKIIEERLIHDALHDGLTGLPNRVLLTDRLIQCWQRYQRHQRQEFQPSSNKIDLPPYGDRFAIIFIDIDRFKRVNDSLGHQAGDQVLATLAQRMETALRAGDTLAHLSGDEFVMLCEEINDPQEIDRLVENLEQAIRQPIHINSHTLTLSASLGVAFSGKQYTQAEHLLRDADIAMYQAKKNGRGKAIVFTPDMHHYAQAVLSLESDLQRAIAQTTDLVTPADELQIYFQPIVRLATGRIQGFEALSRWFHPEQGEISPGDFIELAEQTGLIIPLGKAILRRALHLFAQWSKSQANGQTYSISINISPQQLTEPSFVNEVAAALSDTDMPSSCLHLEITETTMIHNLDVTLRVAQQLQNLGVGLNIDDFGIGYSSLSRIHSLPINALKIDRSFVLGLGEHQPSADIVAAIIALGHSLKLEIIAEGVETLGQCQHLQELGCTYGQGYFFYRPVPLEQIHTQERV